MDFRLQLETFRSVYTKVQEKKNFFSIVFFFEVLLLYLVNIFIEHFKRLKRTFPILYIPILILLALLIKRDIHKAWVIHLYINENLHEFLCVKCLINDLKVRNFEGVWNWRVAKKIYLGVCEKNARNEFFFKSETTLYKAYLKYLK